MDDRRAAILATVDDRFDEQTDFLAELTRQPSTRGNERGAQELVAEALRARGYPVDVWRISVEDIAGLPGFSPVHADYTDAIDVVATSRSRQRSGRSLILNGHIDVVPEGPHDMWASPPYEPRCEDGWMYGRGVGDMKAGLVANIFALDALRELGWQPAADVFVQSVVEEECTGNGALATQQRGYLADAALIPEPFDEQLVAAQVGVVWFQIRIKGVPVHVFQAGAGVNAIEASTPLVAALHELEADWNRPERRNPHFAEVDHPLNLNVGMIRGGDWASSVPSWCDLDVRMAVFPGQDLDEATREIEACVRDAADSIPYLRDHPPEIVYNGFLAEGYALADDTGPDAAAATQALRDAHRRVTGDELIEGSVTATTDARFFGLYDGVPALVYGPRAERIHGLDERVELDSVRRVTGAIALFVAEWCGLEPVGR